jgi:hypothetical protein
MKIYKIAEISKEMEDWFKKRTDNHIALVQKWCKAIENYDPNRFKGLIERGKIHDQSKFEDPEKTPYIYTTWQYKCKDDGKEFNPPQDIKDQMSGATFHHVKHNAHHPESHTEQEQNILNRENRDAPPEVMVDATKMKDIDIGEMCADWMAMSDEKKSNPKDWADKNVNVRWKFTDEQKDLIYELIDGVWE